MSQLHMEVNLEDQYLALKRAQKLWAKKSLHDRIACIKNFAELLTQNKEGLAKILTQDMGKPITQSRAEIEGAKGRVQYFLDHSEKWLSDTTVRQEKNNEEWITYEPLGVIGHISAWNYPYLVAFSTIIPALIGGNAVMYKPSEYASETGKQIGQLAYEAGIPETVFAVITGDGKQGRKLLDLPLDGYFFTGSVKTGRYIAERVCSKLVPVGLELGGKDPLYVTDEIDDIASCAKSAVDGSFYNNGQSCCAVERIYVHEKVYDSFVPLFLEEANKLKVGDPFDETTTIGPLTRPEHISFLNTQIKDALDKGAKILLGGIQPETVEGFFKPTVLVNVNHTMEVMREETFGPVIGIQKVSGDQEAIELMDATEYGLTASVFSNNLSRARNILEELDVGTGYINCCDRVSSHLPWSGRRSSGMGSTLSYLGILSFVKPKSFNLETVFNGVL